MGNKTLYVKEEDMVIWTKAEKLAPGGVSGLVSRLLRDYVETRASDEEGMTKIVLTLVEKEGERVVRKAFRGRWLISPEDPFNTAEGSWDKRYPFAAAITKNGRLVMYQFHHEEVELGAWMETYENFDEFKESLIDNREPRWPEDFIAAVAAEMGEPHVIEMDI